MTKLHYGSDSNSNQKGRVYNYVIWGESRADTIAEFRQHIRVAQRRELADRIVINQHLKSPRKEVPEIEYFAIKGKIYHKECTKPVLVVPHTRPNSREIAIRLVNLINLGNQ